ASVSGDVFKRLISQVPLPAASPLEDIAGNAGATTVARRRSLEARGSPSIATAKRVALPAA
ncbi:MAG: hypothetical protein AAFU50_05365, partial [Pseudomonadota bacterium]